MTNFEIIEWLIKDGGQYTREQHITLLQQTSQSWILPNRK
ncbi:hypothetical protein LG59_5088 [Serratia ureilytica]|nr:hypothetical protein LG59_5088 [Serratia ureilytica]